jgi:protein-tyrosine phosphatase
VGVVIDMHSHVLPGIDDGAGTLEQSVVIARAAANAGTSTLMATPHVSPRYPNDAETIAGLVRELNERLDREGIELEVRAGAEISMTRVVDLAPEEISRLTLGGGGWLLVEPPFTAASSGIVPILMALQEQGHRVLLAHPERCPAFHREPDLLEAIVRSGVLTSITADSLVGKFGETVRRFALDLFEKELVHNVASDAHDESNRPPGVLDQLERIGLAGLSDWLTQEVPSAILDGGEVPPRPDVAMPKSARPHRWRLRR